MKFIDKIKKLREEQSLTQRQVAAELGIDVAMYNRLEKGERSMKRELVKNLAHVYGISEDELLTLWLAGKVYALLSEEDFAEDVISMVAEDITFNNNIRKTVCQEIHSLNYSPMRLNLTRNFLKQTVRNGLSRGLLILTKMSTL